MKKQTTVKGVLLAAARLLERSGWCQNSLHDDGRYCVVGALNHSITGDWDHPRTRDEVAWELLASARRRLAQAVGVEDIVAWNNAMGQRRRHVIAALRKAARTA